MQMKLGFEITPLRLVGLAVGAIALKCIDEAYLDGAITELASDVASEVSDGFAALIDSFDVPSSLNP